MNNSLIPEIAKMLGVEIGEEFVIGRNNGLNKRYSFSEKHLLSCNQCVCDETLLNLVKGNITLTKLPWKPNDGDKYWSYSTEVGAVTWFVWSYRFCDKLRLKSNIIFRTEKEAEANVFKVTAWLNGDNDACI